MTSTSKFLIGAENMKMVNFSGHPAVICIQSRRKGVWFHPQKVIKKCIFGNVHAGLEIEEKGEDGQTIQKKVAIKIAKKPTTDKSPENPVTEAAIHKFISAKAKCPHINKLIEVIEEGNFLYMVSEFCDEELFDVLKNEGPYQEPQARRIFRQIVMAVEAMHTAGVAHRDLSLENVMLSACGNVRVIDFGMACLIKGDGKVFDTKGKTYYMTPAMFYQKNGYDAKEADIWALGPILCILIIGFPPWEEAKTNDERFVQAVNGNIKKILIGWGHDSFSEELYDLLQKLICWNGTANGMKLGTGGHALSASEILKHPWLAKEEKS